jgi:hypothetical protein
MQQYEGPGHVPDDQGTDICHEDAITQQLTKDISVSGLNKTEGLWELQNTVTKLSPVQELQGP